MIKSKVYIIYTGGTIGMAPQIKNNPASPLEPKKLEELKEYIPVIKKYEEEGRIEFGEVAPFSTPLDSSDVKPEHWKVMAREVEKVYHDYDGFIILHGTDTMAFTSSALSFIFENLNKPVIVTGSQLPASDPRTDAVQNFTNSIHIAAYKSFNLKKINEVVICFADKIIRGNRATKYASDEMSGFNSPNFPLIGTCGEHIVINEEFLSDDNQADFIINPDLNDNILNFNLFPGFKARHLKNLIDDEIEGIILNTYGSGNAPNDEDFLRILDETTKRGKMVLNVTQCKKGMVEMGLYASSSGLLERGVVSALDMTVEAATTKLMWVISNTVGESNRILKIQMNQRGEQSQNLFDLQYGSLNKDESKSVYTNSAAPGRIIKAKKIKKIIVRISDFSINKLSKDIDPEIAIFVNKPAANTDNFGDDIRQKVFTFKNINKKGKQILIEDITESARALLGQDDIYLSVISNSKDTEFHFKGLFLTIFAKSDDRKL
ncbi:MAG: asparaginase [Bacteroidales bacterium]|nr:asparaginase [Bacteroidales bacterium]